MGPVFLKAHLLCSKVDKTPVLTSFFILTLASVIMSLIAELTNVGILRINIKNKKYSVVSFIAVTFILIYSSKVQEYVHYHLNFIFCTFFRWSRCKMMKILHVQYCNKQRTLYEQVDALREKERSEENHATMKQNLTQTGTENYSSLRRCYWRLFDGCHYYQN